MIIERRRVKFEGIPYELRISENGSIGVTLDTDDWIVGGQTKYVWSGGLGFMDAFVGGGRERRLRRAFRSLAKLLPQNPNHKAILDDANRIIDKVIGAA